MVSGLIIRLHQAGKHKHVVAAIEAALRHGQSQPWMYEVLALSMKIVGRPKEDIERVLLSQVDFTAADVPSMIYSAAYLTRMKGDKQALHLYRQASRLDTMRPEPYILGLKLARKLDDYDSVQWAAAGILTYAWTNNFTTLHRQAEDAALEAEQALRKTGKVEQADTLKQAINQARHRDLVLQLTWSGDGDLDLVVEEPLGTICSVETPRTTGGGILLHDGYGPKQKNCHEDYVCPFGVSGDYRVKIKHIQGNIVGKRAKLKIVRYQGTADEITRTVTVPIEKPGKVVRLSLHQGRRKKLSSISRQRIAIAGPSKRKLKSRRKSLWQLVNGRNFETLSAASGFSESRQRPFVTGVRANPNGVGFTPIITILSEGVSMTAMAIVSADRRYVRISLSPSFTVISDVFTFSFQGTPQSSGQTTGGGNSGTNTGTPSGQPTGSP